jgi:hypothetical protein
MRARGKSRAQFVLALEGMISDDGQPWADGWTERDRRKKFRRNPVACSPPSFGQVPSRRGQVAHAFRMPIIATYRTREITQI